MNRNKEVDSYNPPCRAVIIGCGSYAPEKILTNDELSKMVDTELFLTEGAY